MVDAGAGASTEDNATVRGSEISRSIVAVDVEAGASRQVRDVFGLERDCLRTEARVVDTETDQPPPSRERAKRLTRFKR